MRLMLGASIVAAAVAIGAVAIYNARTTREVKVEVLDPAGVIVVRTPGGMLEVATLTRPEEFGWSTRYTCPIIDCPELFAKTVSRLRVPVHYVYRVPLGEKWELTP